MNGWQFAIDVGGTFCDVVARDPTGRTHTFKLLSSGRTKGSCSIGEDRKAITDARRANDPKDFWVSYRCALLDDAGDIAFESRVTAFERATGKLSLERPVPEELVGCSSYELGSDDQAPITAIRYLMGLRLDEPIPPCAVRLGTTLATNALLERRGARVAFVTTEGFEDLLLIGDQTRPKLFELNIVKPPPLCETSIGMIERIDADGEVLTPLDRSDAERKLAALKSTGIDSIAVCLLNAYRNPVHERALGESAQRMGFVHVSLSTDLSPTQRLLHRAETCVADAYLTPVFRGFIESVRAKLPGSRLLMMTGSGGLVGCERFNGYASVLSGPAGGLIGAAEVARRAGFERVITFDMGGTSTDVARYEGRFELEYETRKAGVRIVTPVLAIETVAAGGGSICRFDGYRFQVGPESAGTDPGPACYGRGGPLTLTDANLHLGRISERYFPFPTNREAVRCRLDEITRAVDDAGAKAMSHDEIAEGFVRIADASMGAAVRRITTERGVDPRDFALISFGGAGGQHACAVARALGISRILMPASAGVLSAYGIAVAQMQRLKEQAVHRTCSPSLYGEIEPVFARLEQQLLDEFATDGVAGDRVRLEQLVDARYVGEGPTLTVPVDDCSLRFEELHRTRYGYQHAGRDIEIVTARVRATAKAERLSAESARPAGGDVRTLPADSTVLPIGAIKPGRIIEGPAIVAAPGSTLIVDAGFTAAVDEHGTLILTDRTGGAEPDASSTDVDPVRLELFNNRFAAVAEHMGTTLRRTALSTNVKERLDYSCAVFSADGELLANAPHIPVHLGSMAACVRAMLSDVPDIEPGDVLVTNDPYRGGTHLPDVTVVTPVRHSGSVRFFVASRAHHAEIGGRRPGSMPPDSTTLAEEGVLIPTFKLLAAGRERFDKMRRLLTSGPHPSRRPDENIADLVAQTAANRTGSDALVDLLERYGTDVVEAFTRHVRQAAEHKVRDAIRKLPDGAYERTEMLDDGSPIQVRVTVAGDGAVVDFTGTAPVHAGNFNATPAIVCSAVLYCFRCLIDEDIPLNGGVLAPIRIVLPPCMLNPPIDGPPERSPAVAAGNVETSQRIVDCIFGALGVVAGSQGTMNNLSFGNDAHAYYETICGGAGAGPEFDGADAVHTHMTNTRMTDPEVLEARHPVRLRRFAIRRGSGGRGRRHGGDGVVREIEFLESVELSLITQRRSTRPPGLAGGEPGQAGRNLILRSGEPDAEFAVLPSVTHLLIRPGDRLRVETPGGGGCGEIDDDPR